MLERNVHPVACVFPLMEGKPFDELVEDIRAHGLVEPIVEDPEGAIIDGRNRYRACIRAGVKPRFETKSFKDEADLVAWIISKNLKRRHLDETQRALVAANLANINVGDNQHRKDAKEGAQICAPSGDDAKPPISQAEAAEMLNVSRRSVQQAKKVLDHGTPELVGMVEKGEVSINAAAAVATLPKAEQRKAAKKGPAAVKEKAKQAKAKPTPVATDREGNPLPEGRPDIHAAFANASTVDHALNLLTQITADVNSLIGDGKDRKCVSGGEWLGSHTVRPQLIDAMKNLRDGLNAGRPHAVCPYCQGRKGKCDGCRGIGFVPRDTWERSPKSYRDDMKNAAAEPAAA